MRYFAGLIITLLIAASCEEYKHPAKGQFFDVTVMMDSTMHESALADTMEKVFGYDIVTLPAPEDAFDLNIRALKTQKDLEQAKRSKNVIFVATLDGIGNVSDYIKSSLDDQVIEAVRQGEVNAIEFRDRWATNQSVLFLIGKNAEELSRFIGEAGHNYVRTFNQRELARWEQEVFDKGRQVQIEDSLWNKYGWKFGIQHDYKKHVDTLGFVTFRRYLPKNDRWIWIWWQDSVKKINYLDNEWINAKRDSIMERHIRGSREDSYVTTEYRRNVFTEPLTINGNYALRTTGTWRMTNDLMGGPFVNYTIYDEDTQRLFMLEFSQFAPKYTKRRFVRQFQAMGRTFKSDSTFKEYKLEEPNKKASEETAE